MLMERRSSGGLIRTSDAEDSGGAVARITVNSQFSEDMRLIRLTEKAKVTPGRCSAAPRVDEDEG